MTTLTDREWATVRDRFTAFLNRYPGAAGDVLPQDYFNDHQVLADYQDWSQRFLIINLVTDDDGGPTILFLIANTTDLSDISFATWTFDTITTVWIDYDGKETNQPEVNA